MQVIQGRIATRSELLRRNIILDLKQAVCPLCSNDTRTPDHLQLPPLLAGMVEFYALVEYFLD